ncbi:GPN-loop GTPase 2 [Entamoeba marina]
MNVIYGQLITGAPGSGKTTFIKGMYQFLKLMGRDPLIINLDPANVLSDYPSSVSLPSLISLDIAMQTTDLGPNGGMLYCLEYLNENIDWLIDQIEELHPQYVLIDCPGQTELFTTHDVLPTILVKLAKINCRLTAVHLIDSLHISNPSTYMAAILQGLACNMNMELPFIPFLSKADLLSSYGLDIRLINYCSGDIEDILFDVPERFEKLSKGLARVIDDYSLVKPVPLNVEDKDDMALAVALIDKANGYCFTSAESSVMSYFSVGSGSSIQLKIEQTIEKYQSLIDNDSQ